MRRLVLIANPIASGFTAAMHGAVTRTLTGPFDVTAVWPQSPQHSRSLAADAAADGYDVVAAMGGDGLIHQVANALRGSATSLGIVPVGTTNVLARVLGIPRTPIDAAALIVEGRARPVDIARIEADSPAGARDDIALFAAGVGLDAEVVARAEREPLRKVRFGSIHYARSAAAVVLGDLRRRLPTMRVVADDRRADAATVLVQVHDLYTFFGRVPLRLTADPGAGLTVAVVERAAALRVMRAVGRAATRRDLTAVRGVDVWKNVERLVVEAEPPAWFEADGELLGTASRIEIALGDRPLSVVAP